MVPKKKISQVKYAAAGAEDFQPGSHRTVLRNKLGIIKVREIEDAELKGYIDAEVALMRDMSVDRRFAHADVDGIHKLFLGEIYDWAGKQRDVNLSKGGFTFAPAKFIPQLMV